MTKHELTAAIAAKTDVPEAEIKLIVELTFDTIATELKKGNDVTLRGFATFLPKFRKGKTARNLQKNTVIDVPAHFIPYAKFSKEIVEGMKDLKK